MTFAVLFSCDTDNEPDEDPRSEEANIISNNVEIKGASMLEGEPPTPNGGISLALVNASTAAYEDVGFTIPISSDGDIVGTYLRFVSEDGKVADNYYDINIEDNLAGKSAVQKNIFSKKLKDSQENTHYSKIEEDVELKVGLSPEIKAGETFCYEICVYDAQGNISQPQQQCITVNAWANNNALIGKWNLIYQSRFDDGNLENYNVKQDYCYQGSINCNNGNVINVTSTCINLDYEFFDLKSNGDYTYEYKYIDKNLNIDLSESNCSEILDDDVLTIKYSGKWSFDKNKQFLVLVNYQLTIINNEDSDTVDYSNDPRVLNRESNVTGSSLEITRLWRDTDGDGNPEKYSKDFYTKE